MLANKRADKDFNHFFGEANMHYIEIKGGEKRMIRAIITVNGKVQKVF